MVRHCWRCAAVLPAVPPTTCASCGEVHYVNPKPCANAIVIDGPRILLALRARDPDAGRWTIPGGFCEGDEHPMRAAERELCEELGVRGHAVGYVGAWMDTYGPPAPDGLQIHTVVSGYFVALDDPAASPQPDEAEVVQARWFDFAALPEPIAFPRSVTPMLEAAIALARRGITTTPLPDRTW